MAEAPKENSVVAKRSEIESGFSVAQDRYTFLRAVTKLCPQFWTTLRDDVLPHLPADVSIISTHRGIGDPPLAPMRPSFENWTKKFHIETVEWLHRIAIAHLQAWSENERGRRELGMPASKPTGFLGLMSSLEPIADITFRWDPRLETGAAFLDRVKKQVRSVSAPGRKKGPLSQRDAEWFVLRLFNRRDLSSTDIKNRYAREGYATGGTRLVRRGRQKDADSSIVRKTNLATSKQLGIPI